MELRLQSVFCHESKENKTYMENNDFRWNVNRFPVESFQTNKVNVSYVIINKYF